MTIMLSAIARAAFASIIALTAVKIAPGEIGYVLAAIFAGSIVELDQLIYPIRERGTEHARSVLRELPGLALAGIAAALLYPFNAPLAQVTFIAFVVHLSEDWILGKSTPFVPVDNTPVQFFAFSPREKIVIDVLILASAGVLWAMYLSGGLQPGPIARY